MKRYQVLLMLAIVAVCLALSSALAEDHSLESSVLTMPSSLRIIEESAFENTAPTSVFLPESVEYIGDRAFAGTARLAVVFIPPKTQYIGENAFAGCDGLVIVGAPGSYAQKWAIEHGYRFVSMDVWLLIKTDRSRFKELFRRVTIGEMLSPKDLDSLRYFFRSYIDSPDTDPKKRAELYPIEYDFP